MKDKHAIDMTHGPLLGKILRFSLPLMAANLLQLLFNAADVVVVGQFAGSESLAAVSSTTCVIYLVTNLMIGIAVGVNVLLAHYIGLGGHEKEISRAIHTAVSVAVLGGIVFAVIGIASSNWMLGVMSVPENVRPLARVYLRIYYLGTPFLLLYNYGNAALRAKGDTRDPLIFMIVSGCINIVLNLVFVICFHLNVVGVGAATVISQIVSAALILICLGRSQDAFHFSWRKLCLDKRCLYTMARIGIPSGVQACLFSLSNVVIQGAINLFGSAVIAGVGAAESIEGLLYTSMNTFHQACQTFISQNLGAKQYQRVNRVIRTCLLCTLVLGITQSALTCVFAHQLISIYNTDPAVVAAGAERLWIVASVYVIFGLADVLVGGIRGCGMSIAPMLINLLGTCVLRLVWVAVLDVQAAGVEMVYLSYPFTWAVILIAFGAFWLRLRKKGFDTLHTMDRA